MLLFLLLVGADALVKRGSRDECGGQICNTGAICGERVKCVGIGSLNSSRIVDIHPHLRGDHREWGVKSILKLNGFKGWKKN